MYHGLRSNFFNDIAKGLLKNCKFVNWVFLIIVMIMI